MSRPTAFATRPQWQVPGSSSAPHWRIYTYTHGHSYLCRSTQLHTQYPQHIYVSILLSAWLPCTHLCSDPCYRLFAMISFNTTSEMFCSSPRDSQTEMPKAGASLQLSLVDVALSGELPVCSTRPENHGGLSREWFHSGLLTQQSLRHSGPGNEGIEDNAMGK